MLDHPSLAAMLPNGTICPNDDYNQRVVIINPKTIKIVWQYGHLGRPGKNPRLPQHPTASATSPSPRPANQTRRHHARTALTILRRRKVASSLKSGSTIDAGRTPRHPRIHGTVGAWSTPRRPRQLARRAHG